MLEKKGRTHKHPSFSHWILHMDISILSDFQQLCANIGCNLEDLSGTKNDADEGQRTLCSQHLLMIVRIDDVFMIYILSENIL